MPVKVRPHPAKFSTELYDVIRGSVDTFVEGPGWILDPFAGIGRIHEMFDMAYAIELEAEWADQSPRPDRTWQGDFFDWVPDRKIAAVVTSPTYGNRMADHHDARDASYRATYRHALGRPLSPNNSGGMQWGVEYRSFHIKAWARVWEILAGGGLFVLNVKDHVRKSAVVPVVDWHRKRALSLGFALLDDIQVATPGMRRGENSEARVDHEHVIVFRRPRSESTWAASSRERRGSLAGVAEDLRLARREEHQMRSAA